MAGAIVLGSLNTTQASSSDGSHVLLAIFIDELSMAIKYWGLDPSFYNGHSFRTGAADAGMSDSQIRALGHWKSDAFHNI